MLKMTEENEIQFLEHEEYVKIIKTELEKITEGDLDKLEQCEDLANSFATYDRNVLHIVWLESASMSSVTP